MKRFAWTPTLDEMLKTRRAAGGTWDGISREIGVSRNVVIARAARLGIPRCRPQTVELAAPAPLDVDPFRLPLPAGHPISWGAMNAGTQLADQPYPLPVFI